MELYGRGIVSREGSCSVKVAVGLSMLGASEGSVEVKGDGAAPGPEGGGPGPAAPAPQTLLAGCELSAARYIAGVGTIVAFNVSVCSSVSTSATVVSLTIWLVIGADMATV